MDISRYQIESAIRGDSEEDTLLLRKMAVGARNYMSSFDWCSSELQLYLAYGVGGVVGVFIAELEKPPNERDKFLWVIQGDLPSAYLVTDEAQEPAAALVAYCRLMDDWIRAVREGTDLNMVFPVASDPIATSADSLEGRISFLRQRIIPRILT
ncbi:MAG: hypothetical protein ABI599_10580 [Flavobacteriales bacterium]